MYSKKNQAQPKIKFVKRAFMKLTPINDHSGHTIKHLDKPDSLTSPDSQAPATDAIPPSILEITPIIL